MKKYNIYNNILEKDIDLNKILIENNIIISLEDIIKIYNEEKRFYHNFEHIKSMIENIKIEDTEIIIAILFHDIVYDIHKNDNEEKSVEFFIKNCESKNENLINVVKQLILSTKIESIIKNEKEKIIYDLDNKILYSTDLIEILKWEENIFKEYQNYNIKEYKKERIKFLKNMYEKTKNENLIILIKIIENKKYKIGFYPGSFNPFHIGHYNILKKAEKVFDKVIIGFGKNIDKKNNEKFEIPKRIMNREIIEYDGLITTVINELNKHGDIYMVRGLRNEYDLHYEENLRNAIKDFLPEQYFVYFFCDKEYEHISSGLIRDIMSRGDKMSTEFFKKYCIE